MTTTPTRLPADRADRFAAALVDLLTELDGLIAVLRLRLEVEAGIAQARRRICPVDGCLILPGEACPACRVEAERGRWIACYGCGTLVPPDLPCGTCAAYRTARRAS